MNYQPVSSYIYKTIWSFFVNKLNLDIYKRIKNISFDYINNCFNKYDDNIFFMSSLLQLMSARWRSGKICYYFEALKNFKRIGHLSDSCIKRIRENINNYANCQILTINDAYDFVDKSIKSRNINVSFFYFALSQTILCKIYGGLVIFNCNLFNILFGFKNKKMKRMSFETIADSQFLTKHPHLKKQIITYCLSNKSMLEDIGIKHLWLFGSINDKQYHDNSDIDMIVECNSNCDFEDAFLFLSMMLFKQFKRKSDLHLINDNGENIIRTNAHMIF